MSYKIETHDYDVRLRNARKFITQGHRVRKPDGSVGGEGWGQRKREIMARVERVGGRGGGAERLKLWEKKRTEKWGKKGDRESGR